MALFDLLKRVLIVSIVTFIFIFVLLRFDFYEIYIKEGEQVFTHTVSIVDRDICVTDSQEFKDALAMQDLGVAQIEKWRLSWTLSFEQDFKAQWDMIPEYYNAMWTKVRQKLNILELVAELESNEIKYMIDLKSNNDNCNIVTLGVGFNVKAEKAIVDHRPQCHFLGADPERNGNEELYQGIKPLNNNVSNAHFVQTAVRGSSGSFTGEFWQKDGTIRAKTINSLGITQFLLNYNKDKLIDLLLVDVEGSEYEILEKLVEDYKSLPTICQINIELHHPPHQFNATYERFFWNLDRLLLNGYILLNTDYYKPAAFLRIFVVNFLDEECVRKFLC